jgi:hypothetical protein
LTFAKIFLWTLLILAGTVILIIAYLFAPSVWNHYVTYPELDNQMAQLETRRIEPPKLVDLNCYRGILHAHCYWSHDSRGILEEIIPAAKKANINFIFFTDHQRTRIESFPRAIQGTYDGIIIEPGSEKKGLLVWPLDSMIIDWDVKKGKLIKQIISDGGLVFYGHTEKIHSWLNPDYQGMEIYNVHTDSKDENISDHAFNFTINGNQFRRWAYWEFFDEQTEILARWDSLNMMRKIIGISAADAHDNQNIRARYLPDGRVEWVGPNADPIDTTTVGILEKLLLSEPDSAGWAFKWAIDTYYESFRLCTNYILADSLDKYSLVKHLLKGHLYIAFQSLADAKGFMFFATNKSGDVKAIMGDSVLVDEIQALKAVSPLPGQFRLIRNGDIIDTVSNVYEYVYNKQLSNGVYRLEVAIPINAEWAPWIYSNPIYIY